MPSIFTRYNSVLRQQDAEHFGRTIATIDPLANRTEMVYNRLGKLLEQRDPMGRTRVTEKLLPSLIHAASGKSVTAKTISHAAPSVPPSPV